MEESENALLEEIRKAEQIESELSNLIDVERNMNGGNLNDLYLSKLTINEWKKHWYSIMCILITFGIKWRILMFSINKNVFI